MTDHVWHFELQCHPCTDKESCSYSLQVYRFFSEALCYEFSSFQWVTWPKSLTLLRFEVAGSEYRCFDSVISKVWDVQIISCCMEVVGRPTCMLLDAAPTADLVQSQLFGIILAHGDQPRVGFQEQVQKFTFMSLQKSDGRKNHLIFLPWKKCYVYIFYIICRETFFLCPSCFIGLMVQWSINSCRPGPGGFAASDFELRSCEVPSCQENQATPHPVVRLIRGINGKWNQF